MELAVLGTCISRAGLSSWRVVRMVVPSIGQLHCPGVPVWRVPTEDMWPSSGDAGCGTPLHALCGVGICSAAEQCWGVWKEVNPGLTLLLRASALRKAMVLFLWQQVTGR